MRAIWTGSIAFGLVNVPVKVYSATADHDIRFHQVHAKDNGRIRYKRVCEACGEVVDYRDLARAYESGDGKWWRSPTTTSPACLKNAAGRSRCWSSSPPPTWTR